MRSRIQVSEPIVELDGDEMARVVWHWIKEKERDRTGDQVTRDAAYAIKKCKVGVKCATITPDQARVKEFNLKQMWPSPNATLRAILRGTVFRRPIVMASVPRPVPAWIKPIVVARHAVGDQYAATQFTITKPGTLELTFTPEDGSAPIKKTVHSFKGSGVALAMVNEVESITDFARTCFNFAVKEKLPLYLSTKNTILTEYDGLFKCIFENLYEREFKMAFASSGLSFQHRLIDDMAAQALILPGGFVWALKNYDGDVQSDAIAQGFGSLGLMSSELLSPDGSVLLSEAAHGTVTYHYKLYQKGEKPLTNPIALIFAWSRGLKHRAALDENAKLAKFATLLESICVQLVEEGIMTRDLSDLIKEQHERGGREFVYTDEFIDCVKERLEIAFNELESF